MIRKRSSQAHILWGLRVVVAVAVAWGVWQNEWEVASIGVVALALTFLPELIRRKYQLLMPIEFDIIIVSFVFASVFLGEVGDAYERFWWWDALLHLISGVILAMVALLILYTLRYQNKLQASPFIIAMFVFTFGLALGTVWEIFEFAADSLLGTNMQKSGLQDTMWDLIVDAIGSLLVAVMGYSVIKTDNRHGIVGATLHRFLELNPHLKRRHIWRKDDHHAK